MIVLTSVTAMLYYASDISLSASRVKLAMEYERA